MPLEYVATCLQISLDALGALGNSILVPGSQEFFDFAASQPSLTEVKFRRTIDHDGLFIFSILSEIKNDTRDHNIVADVLDEGWRIGTEMCFERSLNLGFKFLL
ncbi:hypothetical protein P692DRAFT_20838806 [Suillus brevipes Sb2]|nr:hypothetical protein P692DRAFT_20838806 [Suillus brevipes Sb2]